MERSWLVNHHCTVLRSRFRRGATAENWRELREGRMSRHEDRLDFDDYDDTPGKSWDDFDGRLKNYAAGRTDDRGWSLADHFSKVDEGSVNGPALPAGNATE